MRPLRRSGAARPTIAPQRTARSWLVWGTRYGLPGLGIRLAARRGDLIARSAADPAMRDAPAVLYPQLHALGPIGGNKLISATAHHAVANQVLRHEAFLVEPAGASTALLSKVLAAAIDPHALGPVDAPSLLAVQPPQHTRIRKLVTHAFSPRAITGYQDRIRATAEDLLDAVEAAEQPVDLIGAYAALLPLTVIADIIGVPVDMRSELLRIGNEAAQTLDPVLSWRAFRQAERAIREGNSYLDEHIATLRRAPGDDLLSELIRINADGEHLSDEELRVTSLLLLGAGFETTINLIGNAVVLLLRHPEQLALLRADPTGWGNAVDEALRYDSPVQITVRIPREDVEIAGHSLPAGRPLLVMLGAANRDPAVFPDPNRFDVRRPEARQHLAFSAGIHYCLGAQLAKLEARIALQALFERFPDLSLAGPPRRGPTRVLHGYAQLPVLTSRRTAAADRRDANVA